MRRIYVCASRGTGSCVAYRTLCVVAMCSRGDWAGRFSCKLGRRTSCGFVSAEHVGDRRGDAFCGPLVYGFRATNGHRLRDDRGMQPARVAGTTAKADRGRGKASLWVDGIGAGDF